MCIFLLVHNMAENQKVLKFIEVEDIIEQSKFIP